MSLPLLSCVAGGDLASLKALLQESGYHLLELDGRDIEDGASFFRVAIGTLPLDPPLSGRVNWDAFSDSLWGGLDALAAARVAIVWTAVERILERGLHDMLEAVDCLREVSRSVRDPKTGIGVPVDVVIILVGLGPNFRPLSEWHGEASP